MIGSESLLAIQILGRVRATLGDVEIELGPPKQRAVLALLALQPGHPVSLAEVTAALWEGKPPSSASHLVHTYVARLRQALDSGMPRRQRTNVIGSVPGGYRLTIAEQRIDLQAFRHLAHQATVLRESKQPEHAFLMLGQALAKWEDPQLEDLFALLPQRDEVRLIRQELINATLDYISLGLETGRATSVLSVAERLSEMEPLNEMVQARCLQTLARTGQRVVAMERYAVLRGRLQVELGVDPSPELEAAYREVLDGSGSVGGAVESGSAPDRTWRGRGPVIDGLLGRAEDTRQLVRLLDRHRMVTLTGPPGVGKSALALTVADATRHRYSDGVIVVDLSTARTRQDVLRACAHAFGLPRSRDCEPWMLTEYLDGHQLLLVLDDTELALDDTAALIDDTLRANPGVVVLVTSRELLGMPYEAVYQVRPLAVDAEIPADPAGRPPEPALQLFARRAAQVRPGFRLGPSTWEMVATICRQLDGLPLAIELAAACMRTDTLPELVARLADPLREIRPTRRGGPSHHGSLRAAMYRSFALLDATEQRCFASLGALAEDFCAEAAAAVAREIAGEQWNMPYLLDRLVDKSVLEVYDGTGGRRYRMLATVRALAREMLDRFGYADRALTVRSCRNGCDCLDARAPKLAEYYLIS